MKTVKNILLYLIVAFYILMGSMHFVKPEQYFDMMPSWLPAHSVLIILTGIIEIVLAAMLLFKKTRSIAAKVIIAMLIVFLFVIHIPQSIGYYSAGSKLFIASIIRLPIQFLFIGWAWLFVNK